MNAINFIKQHGIEKAREVVESAPEKATVVSAETFSYFYKCQDSPVWGRVYRRKDGSEWSWTRFSPIINPIELSDLKRLVESADLINSLDDHMQQDLRPGDIEEEFDALPEETKQKFYDLISDTLEGFLWCNRVWEAWYVGTMSENDFSPAGDDSDVIYKRAVAAYKLHKELK